jgi:hypothetical protein
LPAGAFLLGGALLGGGGGEGHGVLGERLGHALSGRLACSVAASSAGGSWEACRLRQRGCAYDIGESMLHLLSEIQLSKWGAFDTGFTAGLVGVPCVYGCIHIEAVWRCSSLGLLEEGYWMCC